MIATTVSGAAQTVVWAIVALTVFFVVIRANWTIMRNAKIAFPVVAI